MRLDMHLVTQRHLLDGIANITMGKVSTDKSLGTVCSFSVPSALSILAAKFSV